MSHGQGQSEKLGRYWKWVPNRLDTAEKKLGQEKKKERQKKGKGRAISHTPAPPRLGSEGSQK